MSIQTMQLITVILLGIAIVLRSAVYLHNHKERKRHEDAEHPAML